MIRLPRNPTLFLQLLIAWLAIADVALADQRAILESQISPSCRRNAFACDPLEEEIKREIELLDGQLRLRVYASTAIESKYPANILMAICEGFEPEGISQEARCAREWAAYLNITGDADPFAALIAHFGDEEGNRLADRAEELGFKYWPDQMLRPTMNSDGSTQIFSMDARGHFVVPTNLDGVDIDLLVDTGASTTMLTAEDATLVGISLETLVFNIPVETASGQSMVAEATVRNLRVAGLHLRNQVVLVASEGVKLTNSLLGMSVLRRFGGFEIVGNELRLTP